MYALVMGMCLNTRILCTIDVADQRQYIVFHDEQFHDADICEGLAKHISLPLPPFVVTDPVYHAGHYAYQPFHPVCVNDFIPKPADQEISNNTELVPGQLDQVRQMLRTGSPFIINH
jgi:hypothetical protein